jgi:UDP-N-acetylglucosamine 2-epimerase (non-hydrolysing)
MRVLVVVGTRPEAIKMAPVVMELRARGADVILCSTGQHAEMMEPIFDFFGITVDVRLDAMSHAVSLSALFGYVVKAIDEKIETLKPDRILVHGDTSSAAAAALAGFHRRVPVGHVEAGLRTYDMAAPFPEEFNRRLIDLASDLLFAPTEGAVDCIGREQLADKNILVTGNTVVDALLKACDIIDANAAMRTAFDVRFSFLRPDVRTVLVTAHRRESFGEGFMQICSAIAELANRGDVQIVYPVHLNPNVKGPVYGSLGGVDNVHLIDPLDYPSFIYAMRRCDIILTDSGGVQEEAPSLGKPVFVMRDKTERPEGVAAGWITMVGNQSGRIVDLVSAYLNAPQQNALSNANPYGDGRAAERIANAISGPPVSARSR